MKLRYKIIYLGLSSVFSIALISSLYLISEDRIHTDNNFTRQFPNKAVLVNEKDMHTESFYFAGYGKGLVYMGSRSKPLQLTILDSTLKVKNQFRIDLDRKDLPFQTVQLSVAPPDIYVVDPTIPALFRGKITTGKARLQWKENTAIQRYMIIDSLHMAYSFINDKEESELGLAFTGTHPFQHVKDNLLERQVDGLFDADGVLHYDGKYRRLVFLYNYRNQFVVADQNLQLLYRGRTIDTNSIAKVSVTHLKDRNQKKLSAPPLVVNQSSAVYHNLLFVKSGQKSRNEPKDLWDITSVIDVYNLNNGNYVASFYIYDIGKKKLHSFFVKDNHLYGFVGSHLIKYKLGRAVAAAYSVQD